MKEEIRQSALDLGFDDCRFTTAAPPRGSKRFQDWLAGQRHGEMGYLQRNAHKRVDPQRVLPRAKSVILVAASYASREDKGLPSGSARPETSAQRGVIARYARFRDYHDVLGGKLKELTEFVDNLAGGAGRSLWYVDTGPVLERDLAERAGVGFIGKHTNLISRGLGNWIFLGEILTPIEIEPDEPEKNRCGSCTRCLAACPTQAITAPFQLDARRCISYLTIELKGSIPSELRPLVGNRIFGCDDCLEVCPWNRFAREGSLMKRNARPDLRQPDLVELLRLDEKAFSERFEGTSILRTRRRGLLRNVAVALGNTAGEEALPALKTAASDKEPLVAEHARWAIEQIEKRKGGSANALY